VALVLPLGFAFAAGASWLSLASGMAWLFPALVAAVDLALLIPLGPWSRAPGPSLSGALPAAAAVTALLALTQYPMNRVGARGDFLLDDAERIDTAFHVALTWELATSYPPQVPGLSGFPLGYHVASHLIRAQALRWAGIHPYDSLYRFDVTLAALALILALRGAARTLGGGPLAVALVPWTLLANDFSFVFGGDPNVHWWTELLGGNLLLSLVFANSVVPALAIGLAAAVALGRHAAGEGRGWLMLAVVLAAAVAFFKVFVAAQLLAGLAVAMLLAGPARSLALLAAPCLLAVLALALGPGGGSVAVLLDPLAPVARTRQLLGLPLLDGFSLLAWSVPWLAAALGLRLAAIPAAIRAVRSQKTASVVLATLALSGWPIALLIRITADREFNEAVYFSGASGAVFWIFAALALDRRGWAGTRLAIALAAAGALALPASVEFAVRKAASVPDVVPARVLEAMRRLESDSQPGDVVLMRSYSRYPPPPLVFAGRRTPHTLYLPYLRQFAPSALIRERAESVRSFFRAASADEARAIARQLGARHLFLQGPAAMGPGARAVSEPLYIEADTALYRIE
jgi:hypothetical protein